MRIFLAVSTCALLLSSSGIGQISGKLVSGRGGMVVSASPQATAVGVRILKQGGNAVDAAVAVGFTLAVTYPSAGNLGGGTYIMIRLADGREAAIDAREIAPGAAQRDMYLDDEGRAETDASLYGPLAAGVPGTVDGLLSALGKYGRLQRADVMAPAIGYARDGFVPHPRLRTLMQTYADSFRLYASTAACYLSNGIPLKKGQRWKQADLAKTLIRIADGGRAGFYSGETAQMISAAMRKDGGIITEADLDRYRSIERVPLRGRYRGFDVLTMPPSSSGGIALLQMLGTLELYEDLETPEEASLTAHRIAEVMRRAFADRAAYVGDPDFCSIPVDSLLSQSTRHAWYASIDSARATVSATLQHAVMPFREGDQTTHYAVLDGEGNAVSVTTTLNSSFCGLYIVPGTGIMLNNEMDDFSVKPGVPNQFGLLGSTANSIEPGKRMLSSMTPTILLRDGSPWLLTGSPGGSKIITSVLQTVLNIVDFGMKLNDAVSAPRFHHQWYPDRIEYERGAFTNDVVQVLTEKGHKLLQVPSFGRVEGILYDGSTGMMQGCSDPRGYGSAEAVRR